MGSGRIFRRYYLGHLDLWNNHGHGEEAVRPRLFRLYTSGKVVYQDFGIRRALRPNLVEVWLVVLSLNFFSKLAIGF